MLRPIIVALDYSDLESAKKCVDALASEIDIFKVGLELFLNTKGEIVEYIHSREREVFLDLKFHDIPNTTVQAAKFALSQNVFLYNVHTSGGFEMMKGVADITQTYDNSHVIGVTMLTSLSSEDIEKLYLTEASIKEVTLNLAKEAKRAGLHGVVCSPWEADEVKRVCGTEFMTVCPGIRLENGACHDQKRVATPQWAMKNGVDFMVIGRPITQAENPLETVRSLYRELGFEGAPNGK